MEYWLLSSSYPVGLPKAASPVIFPSCRFAVNPAISVTWEYNVPKRSRLDLVPVGIKMTVPPVMLDEAIVPEGIGTVIEVIAASVGGHDQRVIPSGTVIKGQHGVTAVMVGPGDLDIGTESQGLKIGTDIANLLLGTLGSPHLLVDPDPLAIPFPSLDPLADPTLELLVPGLGAEIAIRQTP